MIITNRAGLPDAIVNAIRNDPYDSGKSDFTATGLLKPAQMRALEMIHADKLEDDAEKSLYRLYGQVAHGILERANELDLAEKRFFSEFMGFKVSAQLDTLALTNGVLSDYKFTTSYGFKSDKEPKPEYIAQLNIQLELIRRNGLNATKLQIVGLLRDWHVHEAKRDLSYPKSPIVIQDIPLWSREQTVSYIEMRIAEHVRAQNAALTGLELPTCSDEERWAKRRTWAVVKKDQKRALPGGIHLSIEKALEFAEEQRFPVRIDERPGESVRCENYCNVNKWCKQYQQFKEMNELITKNKE